MKANINAMRYFMTIGIFLTATMMPLLSLAENEEEKTILEVTGDLCTPLYIEMNNGKVYTVWSSEVIYEILDVNSAKDCQGNKVYIPTPESDWKPDQYHYRTYRFKYAYEEPSSTDNTYENTNSSYNNYDDSSSTSDRIATGVGDIYSKVGGAVNQMFGWESEIYPNMQLILGASKSYGEFARLKFCFGGAGGYSLFGGIGKDWIFNGENADKLAWHVGMGYYITMGDDENQDITLGVTFAENPGWVGYSLMLDVSYTHFFGNSKRFGVFGGAGFGVANLDGGGEPKFAWDISIGAVFRICKF